MQTLVTATGDLRQFLDGGVGYTAFGLTFGHDLAILDWNGECYCGGSNDPHTSASHGDGRNGMGLYSFGSGTWTMEGQVEDPLHAPLPSSGVLLLGGLGVALAAPWLRRVRRRQH